MRASGHSVKRLDILINTDIVVSHGLSASFSYKKSLKNILQRHHYMVFHDPYEPFVTDELYIMK